MTSPFVNVSTLVRSNPFRYADGSIGLPAYHEFIGKFAELIRIGYYPFRLGIQSMGSLPPSADDTGRLLERLKNVLDPNHILSPGRYEPKPTEDR